MADQANLCVLFHLRPEYAQKAIEGRRVLDTKEILRVLDEGSWPGYESLHAFVHARAEAIDSYLQPAPLDEIKLALGPSRDLEKFDDAVADITVFLLLATQTLGSAWEPVRQDEAWWQKFRPLRDRCFAFVQQRYGAPS